MSINLTPDGYLRRLRAQKRLNLPLRFSATALDPTDALRRLTP